jgi:hypothetical protein
MKLSMNISYDVDDADQEVEDLLTEIVAEEARAFAEAVRCRLAAEGVRDIQMNMKET